MATKTKDATDTNLPATVKQTGSNIDAAAAADFGGMTGFENENPDNYVIPFFTILQGLSPQMETVDGAKLGKIINVSTNEMFDKINLVAVRTERKFVEWAPNRGGLVAVHEPESEVVKKALAAVNGDEYAPLKTEAGNDLLDTNYIRGVICDEEKRPMGFAALGFSKTKIKPFKAWWTDARNKLAQFGLPMPAIVWTFTSFKTKNAKGEFYNWKHSMFGGNVNNARVSSTDTPALLDAVKAMMARKDLKMDYGAERDTTGDNAGGGANDQM